MDAKLNVLIIGGSGFVGTAVANEAVRRGFRVTVVSRGKMPLPNGVEHLKADRKNPGELGYALCKTQATFDLVVDCIASHPDDIQQDIKLFSCNCGRLVFISTDLVFSPERRIFPQGEACAAFVDGNSMAAWKRKCELVLFNAAHYYSNWTILRPTHLYGEGHLGGCFPPLCGKAHLADTLKNAGRIGLPGGGHFLLQPLLVQDFASIVLACPFSLTAAAQAITCAGPEMVEAAGYFQSVAKYLGLESSVEFFEVPLEAWLAEHPDDAPFLCHRIYNVASLKKHNLPIPMTAFHDGLPWG